MKLLSANGSYQPLSNLPGYTSFKWTSANAANLYLYPALKKKLKKTRGNREGSLNELFYVPNRGI